jgi:endoribonuclease Nob1
LVFRILDASAFYAGVPFGSLEEHHTTPEVFDEVQHIKKNHNALETLIQTKRLMVRQPEIEFIKMIKRKANESGDIQELSKEDISILALCLELQGELVTDDYAVSNVASNLGIKVSPVMTDGIKDVGKWVHYCSGCGIQFTKISECPQCGNPLKRKLLKNEH